MQQKSIQDKPPILFDIGASGDIHHSWKAIAKYCICVAFDPDDREINIAKNSGKGFKEFILINRIVSDQDGKQKFYLTKSPYCSSSLKSNLEKLEPYSFRNLFILESEIELSAITINSILKEIGYEYIDWYKSDTQGTDFRIYDVIEKKIKNKILVSEFEPGILDAYAGEDKLHKIMASFDNTCFWCDDCLIKGSNRLNEDFLNKKFSLFQKKLIHFSHKKCAFWAEISYMNDMKNSDFTERDYLLMIAFAIIKKQYGFVIELCNIIITNTNYNPIFNDILQYVMKKIKIDAYLILPKIIFRKVFSS